jgi:hypothetical protein
LRRENYREEETERYKKESYREEERAYWFLTSERMRGAQATERNKNFFRLFYRKENGKTINSKIPYFFNSFPLTKR